MIQLKIKIVAIQFLLGGIMIFWAPFLPADNHRIVRIGLGQNPPLTIRNKDAPPTGLAIDVVQDIAKTEGWQVEFVEDSWGNLLKQLEANEIDLLTGIAYSEARAKIFDFTSEALISNWGIVYRHPSISINSLLDLDGLRIAMGPKGIHAIALAKLLKDFDVTYTTVETKNYLDVFERVENGEADVGVVSRLFGVVHSIDRKIVATGINFNPVGILFGTPKGKGAEHISTLDAYLRNGKKNPDSSYQKHLQRWIGISSPFEFPLWAIWGGVGMFFGLLIALFFIGVLRHRVGIQTGKLLQSEKNFRNLFENAEISIWNEDLSEVYKALNKLRLEGVEDLRHYLEGNKQAVAEITAKVKVLHVNKATLQLFGAVGEEALLFQIEKTFGANTHEVIIDELCAIWNKETVFRSEAAYRTLDGRDLTAIITFQIPETEEGFKSVPVSIIDITERKQTEEKLKFQAYLIENVSNVIIATDT